jgi:phosphoribosylanthranilate isomerase
MKVQLYSMKTPEDAVLCVAAGVDLIGSAIGERGRVPGEIGYTLGRAIFAQVPADRLRVALTLADQVDEIVELVTAVAPDIVHLSGEIEALPVARVLAIRRAIQPVKIMQAIPVQGPTAVALALAYQRVADYLILDTNLAGVPGIGATGLAHDWSVSAEIVRRVQLPVVLAGGLAAGNVGQAIRRVRPWAVDSFTHTNTPGTKRKDATRVDAFVTAARAVW